MSRKRRTPRSRCLSRAWHSAVAERPLFRLVSAIVVLLVVLLHSCNAAPPAGRPTGSASPYTPFPGPSPTHTATAAPFQAAVPSATCAPLDVEGYLGQVSPLLDRLIIASQEATLIQALPGERISALRRAAEEIREVLSGIRPPRCLEDAHLAALQATSLLSKALEHMSAGGYADAKAALQASFEQSALAIALIGMQYGQRTPTPAPTR